MGDSCLRDNAEIVMGQSPPGETCNIAGVGLPLLNGPTEYGAHHPKPSQYTTDARKRARSGDILFCVRGSTTGRMNWADREYAIGRGVAAIRHKKEPELQPFVRAVIEYGLSGLLAQATGSTFPNVSADQLAGLWWPPLEDDQQRAIAHILGTLDDKIELNRRMNETLEAMARVLFKSWFVDFLPVRAKMAARAQTGDPLPAPQSEAARQAGGLPKPLADLFPDSFEDSELGEIPKGWGVNPLSDCVDVVRGLSYKGSGLSGSGDGVPMYNLNSIYEGGGYKHDGLKHYDGEHKPQHVASAGDLIVANTEQGHHRLLIGYAAIVPTRFGQESLFSHHIFRVRPKSNSRVTADYLCHLLNTSVMHDIVSGYANGTTVNMLPIDALQSPMIAVPSTRVVAAFNNIAEPARRRHEEMVEESRTLAALRDTLLPKLISGEIRIKDAEKFVEAAI